MFIKQGLNPFTRGPLDLFNWELLEPYVEYHSTGLSIAKSKQRRRSWIGGGPEFVDIWPQGPSGPLPFVCQLDLTELSQGTNTKQWPGLPRTGLLSLFYDESSSEYDTANFSVSLDAGDSARTAEGSAASTNPELLSVLHSAGIARDALPAPVLFLELLRECQVDARRDTINEAMTHALCSQESPRIVRAELFPFVIRSESKARIDL